MQLAIKELPLKAVFAPSPVGVDQGQPVVLLVERPMGEDHLVVLGHLDLPGQAGVLYQAGLRAHHSARKSPRTPGVRVSGPDGSVVEGELCGGVKVNICGVNVNMCGVNVRCGRECSWKESSAEA